jgi:gliding motility-associated-like protein
MIYLKRLAFCAWGGVFLGTPGWSQVASFQTFPPAVNGVVQICQGQSITFINTSTGVLPGATFAWNFGTGAVPANSTQSGPVASLYSSPTAGTVVTLSINNNIGTASSIASVSVIVANSPNPLLSLNPSVPGFSTVQFNGGTAFTFCSGSGSTSFPLLSNYSATTSQTFVWGDGLPNGSQGDMVGNSVQHNYAPGQFNLTHTVAESNGCTATRSYTVFNGSAPVITVSGAGSTACIPAPYPITIFSNGVVIDYVVSFTDGSAPISFTTESDTVVTHSFTGTSCGEEYAYSPGLPPIPNAFSASIVASNLCSTNGLPTVFTIGPLTISAPTIAAISSSNEGPLCTGTSATFSDVSESGEDVTSIGCESEYDRWWSIQPMDGIALVSGSLGNTMTSGSGSIGVEFSTPGAYVVWLYTENSCGVDSVSQHVSVLQSGVVQVTPEEQSMCSGSLSSPIEFESSVPGYIIQWQVISIENATVTGAVVGSAASSAVVPPLLCHATGDVVGTVVIQGAIGCSNEAPALHTIFVTPTIDPIASPSSPTVCSGASPEISLSSASGAGLFTWVALPDPEVSGASNGGGQVIDQVLENASNAPQFVHYLISIGDVECPGDPIQVPVQVLPSMDLPNLLDLEGCPGSAFQPSEEAPNVQGAAFSWAVSSSGTGLIGPGIGWVPDWTGGPNNTNSPVTATITVTGQVSNCPADLVSFDVTLNPTVSILANPPQAEICTGTPVSIELSASDPNAQFAWTANAAPGLSGAYNGSGTSIEDVLNNANASPLQGSYSVEISGVECPGPSLEIPVTVYPLLELPAFQNLEGCPGETFEPTADAPAVQGASFSYQVNSTLVGLPGNGNGWLPSWVAAPNQTGGPVVATVTVIGNVANCPETATQFEVTLHASPTFEAQVNPGGGLDCITSTAVIVATTSPSGCSFSWTGNGVVSGESTSTPTVNASGIYTATVVAPTTGCTSTGSVFVGPASTLSIIETNVTDVACAGETSGSIEVVLSGLGPFTFSWLPSVSNTSLAENLPAGNYSVFATNAQGCSDGVSLTIDEPEPLVLMLEDLQSSECGESNGFIQVDAFGGAGGYVFEWNTGHQDPVLDNVDAGGYQVEVTDAQGCVATLDQELSCIELLTPIPNTFISPNEDGLNSVWLIEHIELYPENEVKVYNRWGNCVFSASPYLNSWDGTFTEGREVGKPLPAATYYFVIDSNKESIGSIQGFLEIQSNE